MWELVYMFHYDNEGESYSRRVLYFMWYVYAYGIPGKDDKTKFCDIIDGSNDQTLISSWFVNQLKLSSIERFINEYSKYKNVYFNAYEMVSHRIRLLKNKRDTIKLDDDGSIEVFMKYINSHDISAIGHHLKFCDISDCSSDSRCVIRWLNYKFHSCNKENFLECCFRLKSKYPLAYERLMGDKRSKKSVNVKLAFEDSVRAFMRYVNFYDIPSKSGDLRFCDIDSDFCDVRFVGSWFSYRCQNNLDELIHICSKYKDEYPMAYDKIIKRVYKLDLNLSLDEKIKIFMGYINFNDIPVSKGDLRFCDIYNTKDGANIAFWFSANIGRNLNNFMIGCNKYKKQYPVAYEKIITRVELLMKKRGDFDKKSCLSYEDRVMFFMKYVDGNGIPTAKSNFRFCDMGGGITDNRIMRGWFIYNLDSNLTSFINEYSKYKDIYPNGYIQVSNYINHSKVSLRKQRLELIGTLTSVRKNMVKDSNKRVRKR